jgi:predicted permease
MAIAMVIAVSALSLSNAILLRPPYARNPGQVITIYAVDRAKGGEQGSFSYPEYRDLRDASQSFSGMAAMIYGIGKTTIKFGGRDEMATNNSVSDNYFEVMGIQPYLGRFFAPGADARHEQAVMLTYACWRRWGSAPRIVGNSLEVGGRPLPIIAVAPKPFLSPIFGIAADLILNIASDGNVRKEGMEDRKTFRYLLLGRLKPGATHAQARGEIQTLWAAEMKAYPDPERRRAAGFMGLSMMPPDGVETAELLSAALIGAALLILAIACANTANLLLALASLRRQEVLIKTALGAPRWRLTVEFLRETVALCAIGGAFGYAGAVAVLRRLSSFNLTVPAFGAFPIAADLHPGPLVTMATGALILGASLLSGLAPALHASKPNLASALSGEIAIGGTRRSWIRNTVVTVQVAACTLAPAGTGLCLPSLYNLRHVDPGFSERRIMAQFVFLDDHKPVDQGRWILSEVRRAVEEVAGVETVSIANDLPLGGDGPDRAEIRFPDRPAAGEKIMIAYSTVDENYFATQGIKLLAGRVFRPMEAQKGAEEIVINRYMAEKFWPHQNALGRSFLIDDGRQLATVVGIAADGKYGDLDEAQQAFMYYSLDRHYNNNNLLIVRTRGDPRLWFGAVAQAARKFEVVMPLAAMTIDDWFRLTLFVPVLTFNCVSMLSALAVMLATVGLYAAVSYAVRKRRRELGIRIALGARPGQVMRLVFRQTMAIAGTGVVVGLVLGVTVGVLFRSQFFGLRTLEWRVMAPAGIGMAAASLAIAYAAARRWTRMDPLDAVRHI